MICDSFNLARTLWCSPVIVVSLLCTEFQKIALATLVGFAVMGCIGMAVKLIFIPINSFVLGI